MEGLWQSSPGCSRHAFNGTACRRHSYVIRFSACSVSWVFLRGGGGIPRQAPPSYWRYQPGMQKTQFCVCVCVCVQSEVVGEEHGRHLQPIEAISLTCRRHSFVGCFSVCVCVCVCVCRVKLWGRTSRLQASTSRLLKIYFISLACRRPSFVGYFSVCVCVCVCVCAEQGCGEGLL